LSHLCRCSSCLLFFFSFFFLLLSRPPSSPLFPYTTLFRSRSLNFPTPKLPDVNAWASSSFLGRGKRCSAGPGSFVSERWIDVPRSEEHTSELQSRFDLVCRLLLEKKKQ